jgi:hypothetical protein
MSTYNHEQDPFSSIINDVSFDFALIGSQQEALRDIPKIHLTDMEFGTSLYVTTVDSAFMFTINSWLSPDEERFTDTILCHQQAGQVLPGLDEGGLFIAKGAGIANRLLADETKGVVLRGHGLVYQPVLSQRLAPSFKPLDMPVRDVAGVKYALWNSDELHTTDLILTTGVKGPYGKPVNVF